LVGRGRRSEQKAFQTFRHCGFVSWTLDSANVSRSIHAVIIGFVCLWRAAKMLMPARAIQQEKEN
jgi:hypothetical protein